MGEVFLSLKQLRASLYFPSCFYWNKEELHSPNSRPTNTRQTNFYAPFFSVFFITLTLTHTKENFPFYQLESTFIITIVHGIGIGAKLV